MNRVTFLLIILAGLVVVGCEGPRGYVDDWTMVPPISIKSAGGELKARICFDAVGHTPGTRPFVFGGTCCCTPTAALLAQYHRDGFCKEYKTAEALRAEYVRRGIALEDPGHRLCNGLCPWGPHITLGGHCMASPTPGTETYERVLCATQAWDALAEERTKHTPKTEGKPRPAEAR